MLNQTFLTFLIFVLFCFVCLLNINSFDCCPNHRYMESFSINAILGQSLPRLDKTTDPERDSEPNKLVADAFRAGRDEFVEG
ncbi:unnamed protein product, partial [Porites evermanni]